MSIAIIKNIPSDQVLLSIKNLMLDTSDETKNHLNKLCKELIETNCHLDCIKLLLGDDRIDYNDAFDRASLSGHQEVVKLLLQDQRINPSSNDNYAIKHASKNGHLEIVKILLQDQRV